MCQDGTKGQFNMNTTPQMQAQSGWKCNVGGSIGPAAPAVYGMTQNVPGKPGAMMMWASGTADKGKVPCAEWYRWTPILPNSGTLIHEFDLTMDENSLTNCQAMETDTIMILGNKSYNFSLQINYATGGQLNIANAKGAWVIVSGATPGKLASGTHHYTIVHSFIESTGVYGTEGVIIDGILYAVPSDLQSLEAVESNWTNNQFTPQIQLDITAAAGEADNGFSVILENENYIWL